MGSQPAMNPTTPRPTVPDWSGIQEEIHCPLCDYDLRGIGEPRCPECGYTFDWPDLLDPTRRLHPYLFEHHAERDFWSFWKTAIGGLLPRRFWTQLHPAQPSRPKRLVLYFAWISLICFVSLQSVMAVLWAEVSCLEQRMRAHSRAAILSGRITIAPQEYAPYGSVQGWVDAQYPASLTAAFLSRHVRTIVSACWLRMQVPLLALAWPWATYACLLIFQQSMRRVRLRASHVLRCVIYSSDVFLWAWMMAAIVFAGGFPWFHWYDPLGFSLCVFCLIGVAAAIAFTYRLVVAYRRYLRFDRSIATVLCSQLILWLALLTLAIATGMSLNI